MCIVVDGHGRGGSKFTWADRDVPPGRAGFGIRKSLNPGIDIMYFSVKAGVFIKKR